jgi:hypothetical protein
MDVLYTIVLYGINNKYINFAIKPIYVAMSDFVL